MAVNNEVNITLNAKDKASPKFKNVEKSAGGLGSKLKSMGGPLAAVGASIAAVGVAAGVVGVKMFNMGADMEQTIGKAKTVFGEYYGEMQKFADENAKAMGLTRNEYLKTAAGMQDLLIPMGFTRQEATKMTQETTSLAGALAEWSAGQYNAAQVGDILTAAMLGERDQLKSLGIAISAEEVSQRSLENSQKGVTFATQQQADAFATQQLIFEKSTDAQNAYANGADSLTRKKAEMIATLGNLQETIVGALLPAFHEIVKSIEPIITKVAENISLWSQNKENVEALTGTIKTIIGVFGVLFKIVGTVVGALFSLGEGLGFAAFKVVEFVSNAIKFFGLLKESIIKKLSEIKVGITTAFGNIVSDAKQWGINMVAMFIGGIVGKIGDIKNAVLGVATTISDYLGFHSPTKKGPASDSDKWMPNLVKMMYNGLKEGESSIGTASEGIAKAIANKIGNGIDIESVKEKISSIKETVSNTFSGVKDSITNQKSSLFGLKGEYDGLKEKLIEIGVKGVEALSKIDEQLASQKQKIADIEGTGRSDVAQRALDIEKQIADLKQKQSEGFSYENQQKLDQLNTELNLAKAYAGNESIERQRIENAKSETQLIIDRTNNKITEAQIELQNIEIQRLAKLKSIEDEKAAVKTQISEKEALIRKEFDVYKQLVEDKKTIDSLYFSLFNEKIDSQISKTKEAITLLNNLKKISGEGTSSGNTAASVGNFISGTKANGGDVKAGHAYRVGERGSELFVPNTSGTIIPNSGMGGNISINMGGVTVNNEADENRLVQKIQANLTETLQMYKFGIS